MKNNLIVLVCFFFLSSFQNDESLRWDYNKDNWTPLMNAIYKGDSKTFSRLIKKDKNLTFTVVRHKTFKLTALDIAIRKNNDIAVEMLLKTKQFTNLNDYLITACGQENVKTIKWLISYGANPNYILPNGYTPIFKAIKFGSVEILKEILQRSDNVNKKIKGGVTVLMIAARELDVERVKVLLNYDADKNVEDDKGRKALDYIELNLSEKENKGELINELKELLKS